MKNGYVVSESGRCVEESECERCGKGAIRDRVIGEWADWNVCQSCGDEARKLGLEVVRLE